MAENNKMKEHFISRINPRIADFLGIMGLKSGKDQGKKNQAVYQFACFCIAYGMRQDFIKERTVDLIADKITGSIADSEEKKSLVKDFLKDFSSKIRENDYYKDLVNRMSIVSRQSQMRAVFKPSGYETDEEKALKVELETLKEKDPYLNKKKIQDIEDKLNKRKKSVDVREKEKHDAIHGIFSEIKSNLKTTATWISIAKLSQMTGEPPIPGNYCHKILSSNPNMDKNGVNLLSNLILDVIRYGYMSYEKENMNESYDLLKMKNKVFENMLF